MDSREGLAETRSSRCPQVPRSPPTDPDQRHPLIVPRASRGHPHIDHQGTAARPNGEPPVDSRWTSRGRDGDGMWNGGGHRWVTSSGPLDNLAPVHGSSRRPRRVLDRMSTAPSPSDVQERAMSTESTTVMTNPGEFPREFVHPPTVDRPTTPCPGRTPQAAMTGARNRIPVGCGSPQAPDSRTVGGHATVDESRRVP